MWGPLFESGCGTLCWDLVVGHMLEGAAAGGGGMWGPYARTLCGTVCNTLDAPAPRDVALEL
jgi:hypothetical protein